MFGRRLHPRITTLCQYHPDPSSQPLPSLFSTLYSWESQGASNTKNFCDVYSPFQAMEDTNIGEFLNQVAIGDDVKEVTFCVFMETRDWITAPHFILLHCLVASSFFGSKRYEAPVCMQAVDTVANCVLLYIQIHPTWILASDDRVTINKVTDVYQAIRDVQPSTVCVALDFDATKESVKAVYLPW